MDNDIDLESFFGSILEDADRAIRSQQGKTLVMGVANSFLDRLFGGSPPAWGSPAGGAAPRPQRPIKGAPKRKEAPPPKPKAPELEDPRGILGFSAGEVLTAEKIKERKRSLARMLHPDKGGSPRLMQQVNAAADQLLRSVK